MPSCEGSECLRSGGGCGVCARWDNCAQGVCAPARARVGVCVCVLLEREEGLPKLGASE